MMMMEQGILQLPDPEKMGRMIVPDGPIAAQHGKEHEAGKRENEKNAGRFAHPIQRREALCLPPKIVRERWNSHAPEESR
jgi:hypothetical protein